MYILFRYHNILPGQYFELPYGERLVLRAFAHYEIEQKNKEIEKLNKIQGV